MKNKLIKSLAIVFVCLALALGCISLVGCGEEDNEVKSVSLNKHVLELEKGQTETLVVTLDPNGAATTWTTSDVNKVHVDQNGKVTAVDLTDAPVVVTVKAGDKEDYCLVTVVAHVANYETVPTVKFDLSSGYTKGQSFTEDVELVEGVMWLTANTEYSKTPQIDESSGGVSWGGDNNKRTFTKFIKTNGGSHIDNASIKLVLEKGAKVVLYARSGNSTDTVPVNWYNEDYTSLDSYDLCNNNPEDGQSWGSSTRPIITFVATTGGTYYIGGEGKSMQIYAIDIFYEI